MSLPLPSFQSRNSTSSIAHPDVKLNVKCSSVLKLDVDFMSIRVSRQNNALYYFASDVFVKV